jgi:hypothetical protein
LFVLPAQPQRLATRDQYLHRGARFEEMRQVVGRLENLLEVVEHEKQLAVFERLT